MQVLIIDKSAAVAERLAEQLKDSDVSVQTEKTSSYDKARSYISNGRPEVILLGLDLPLSESINLLADIKKQNGPQVIMLHTGQPKEVREHCLRTGAAAVVDLYHEFACLPELIRLLLKRNVLVYEDR